MVGWRCAVFAAAVTVPEAAVDEDGDAVAGEDEVGATGEAFVVQPESIAQPAQEAPDPFLRRRILTPDPAHVPGAPSLA